MGFRQMIFANKIGPPPVVLPLGVSSYYPFNETSGNTCFDIVRGFNASNVSATQGVTGKIDKALQFGLSYVDIPHAIISGFPFAFSFWIKKEAPGDNRHIISGLSDPYTTTGVVVSVGGNYNEITFGNGGGTGGANRRTFRYPNSPIQDTIWHLVVLEIPSFGVTNLIIDNIEQTGRQDFGGSAAFMAIPLMWWFGRAQTGNFGSGGCSLDDFKVWSTIPTAQEKADLWNNGNG